jgi:hypothetical protein
VTNWLTYNLAFLQDFLPKLKQHLLPRILSILSEDTGQKSDPQALPDPSHCSLDSIIFKHDRIYKHNIARINYTSYDVRRSQDVINASSAHGNIMTLTDTHDDQDQDTIHPFSYARVLGIYHVNVVYVGPGMTDYQPRRLEFLWVRRYQRSQMIQAGWQAHKLDRVQFLPLADDGAFGFIDPSDVMRGCHIVPAFCRGKAHIDGKGLSHCAQDFSDWAAYYVNRCASKKDVSIITADKSAALLTAIC